MRLYQCLLYALRLFITPSPYVPPPASSPGPESDYAQRLARYADQLSTTGKRHQLLWICFLVLSTAAVAAAASALWLHWPWSWVLMPMVLLGWNVRSLTLSTRESREQYALIRFYEGGLARLHSEWQGHGIAGEQYCPADHLYAADLGLFGAGSLFEMLCTARTGIGRATLANWMLHPASPAEIKARQEAVTELRDNLELQERWAIAGDDPSRVTASALADWARQPAISFHPAIRVLAPALPLVMAAVLLLHLDGFVGLPGFLALGVVAALQLMLAGRCYGRVQSIAADVTLPAFELKLLSPLLDTLQREPLRSPLLQRLQSQLSPHRHVSRREIARLRVWSWLLDLRRSEYFAAAASLLLWKTNVAMLVEQWRTRNARRVLDWLEVTGQFEALLCLARYSFENPAHTFPHIAAEGPAFFHAESLGHPLLASSRCVPCDVSLECGGRQIMILSGSNMSGKSTLLRSVGLNAALAMAGAPVRATRLRMSTLRIGCSIAVHDSLLDGKSRFYAEVERLKQTLALASAGNAIVLLDEVLGGTNSQDRLFGTQAVLGQLLHHGAIAIVTTHDLALTELANQLQGRAVNAHFEESYGNGTMRFDYKLRPGVLTRTNGAHLVAALGIVPVAELPSAGSSK